MAVVVQVVSNPFATFVEGAQHIGNGFLITAFGCSAWALDYLAEDDRLTYMQNRRGSILLPSQVCGIGIGEMSYGVLELTFSISMIYLGTVVARRVVNAIALPCLDNVRWIQTQWARKS